MRNQANNMLDCIRMRDFFIAQLPVEGEILESQERDVFMVGIKTLFMVHRQ
jgi:hypothetical protein